jgi:FAD/FMN-containing dehydrogenase
LKLRTVRILERSNLAWNAAPSAYAVTAESSRDVAAAVNFARQHRLRLVIKGTGHDYLGRSNAPDSAPQFKQ